MKRIEVLDGLRGFALLGILLVNINFFNESLMAISFGGLPVEGSWNQVIKSVSTLFVEGKFLLLFSFLFGYGAVILYSNAEAAGRKFAPIFVRRMLALLFFGVLHGSIHLARGYFDKLCIGRTPTFTIHTAEP